MGEPKAPQEPELTLEGGEAEIPLLLEQLLQAGEEDRPASPDRSPQPEPEQEEKASEEELGEILDVIGEMEGLMQSQPPARQDPGPDGEASPQIHLTLHPDSPF